MKPNIRTTTSEQMVTCQACGNHIKQRDACGVGPTGGLLTWTCTDCILQGGMDRVFAPIGDTIRRITVETDKRGEV